MLTAYIWKPIKASTKYNVLHMGKTTKCKNRHFPWKVNFPNGHSRKCTLTVTSLWSNTAIHFKPEMRNCFHQTRLMPSYMPINKVIFKRCVLSKTACVYTHTHAHIPFHVILPRHEVVNAHE